MPRFNGIALRDLLFFEQNLPAILFRQMYGGLVISYDKDLVGAADTSDGAKCVREHDFR